MAATLAPAQARLLAEGTVIPAHPLALAADRTLDVPAQRALTRYYAASGVGGVAVGVHTTQFAIHDPGSKLLEPVLSIAAETLDDLHLDRPFLRIAGACGPLEQAVAEAELAASLGYHAVLLSPTRGDESTLLARAAAVGEVLPVIGFYLQEAVGGRYLGLEFWRQLADQPGVVAVKLAPFDRYRTLEAVRGIAASDRGADVAIYTGNDDAIITDLLTPYDLGDGMRRHVVGGLLGQWAVWTSAAVAIFDLARRARSGDAAALAEVLGRSAGLTDANGAVFDVRNHFHGCVPGINAVLHQQGLLRSPLCLDPAENLSPGQAAEIARVRERYPWLIDDDFVLEHLAEWLG
jgi:dihydrodipicolinate synthase/N-acetylneuraminate lyase